MSQLSWQRCILPQHRTIRKQKWRDIDAQSAVRHPRAPKATCKSQRVSLGKSGSHQLGESFKTDKHPLIIQLKALVGYADIKGMQLTRDEILRYRAGPLSSPAKCRLRIWTDLGKRPVVCFSELKDNPGMSVTNAIETLAQIVAVQLQGPEPIWLDQSCDWNEDGLADVSEVTFELLDPGHREVVGSITTPDAHMHVRAGRYSSPRWTFVSHQRLASTYQIFL